MQVAVARVEHVGEEQVVAFADRDHLAHDLRQLAARHHRVLQQVGGGDAPDGTGCLLASLPQQRALGLVARDGDQEGVAFTTNRRDSLGLSLHLGERPVELDEQHGPGAVRIDLAHRRVDGADHRVVEHLEGGGDDAGRDDRRHRLGGLDEAGERREGRLHRLRQVQKPHRDRGH